ncbi:inositol-1-monophosphatase [Utexia brackfieldae]|uniref:inositol-1-monophosphatase n=1 Tax=Utexia brackfieldae TaxID=3074108 RepID=UPI00370D00F1
MHPMLNIAVRAARKAGTLIIKSHENPDSISVDAKAENDFVTNVDRAAEALIVETIKRAYPDHTIIGEESGLAKGADSETQWIIDPIDGTSNFIKGLPHFCVSIAVRVKGRTEAGVVYDPMRNELFTASRGQGAQLNGYRIRVGNAKDLNGALLGMALPYCQKQFGEYYFRALEKLFVTCGDVRRSGSAALDLVYVAAGRLDGFFEIGLKPWDIAAGELILREAGGVMTDFAGGLNYMASGNVMAGNPKVVKELLTQTQGVWPDVLKR